MAMLEGPELLAKVKEMGDSSKSDLVRSCGYVSSKKDGSERLNFTAFYEALLEAKGVVVGKNEGNGKAGRKLTYVTRVQFNGNLLVGKAYTALMGLTPGEEFRVIISPRKRTIKLAPIGSALEPGDLDLDDSAESAETVDDLALESASTAIGEADTIQTVTLTEKDLALAAA
jgi:hypothetical protein